jgi:hypothetical protein
MYNQFIAERCVEALSENEEYLEMEQNEETDPDVLQARQQEICYRKGFLDAMAIVMAK